MSNHRYTLRRDWNAQGKGILNFIMLNPSTADDVFDDATIRRCVGFAKRWGFSSLVVTNLFAYRATDPKDLKRLAISNPALAVGDDNDRILTMQAHIADAIVCAWGNHGDLLHRDLHVCEMLKNYELFCIRRTINANPAHPVREPYTDSPMAYLGAAEERFMSEVEAG